MEERIKKIKESLREVHQWPSVYIFKFIFENSMEKREEVLSIFSEDVEVGVKYSREGNYVSLTIKEVIYKSQDVLDRYLEASKVEGVIAL